MAQILEDPKAKLARGLSDISPGHLDLNSDFPTPAVVRYQLFNRTLANLGVGYYKEKADTFAEIMWSLGRGSRGEFERSITVQTTPQNALFVGAQPETNVKKKE